MKIVVIITRVIFVTVLLSSVIGGFWIISDIMSQVYHPENLLDKCREYESDKSIPNGSCDCALRIYPNFNKSYDWMDACEIEEARKNQI